MPNRYTTIAKEILYYLAVGGAIAIAATSPYFVVNLFRVLTRKRSDYQKLLKEKKKIADAFYRLRKSRLVLLQEKEDGTFVVELTEKGRKRVRQFQFQDLSIKKPAKWDNVWRIIVFDIPNKKKAVREALRQKLKVLEFYQLQESVWVHPYPCEKEIEFIVELFHVYPFVHMIEARSIQNDVKLKAHFKLL